MCTALLKVRFYLDRIYHFIRVQLLRIDYICNSSVAKRGVDRPGGHFRGRHFRWSYCLLHYLSLRIATSDFYLLIY